MIFRIIILTFFVVLAMLFTVQLRSADSVKNSVFHELSKLTYLTEFFNFFRQCLRTDSSTLPRKRRSWPCFMRVSPQKTLLRGWIGTSALWERSSATTRSCRLKPLRCLPKNGLVVQAFRHPKSSRDSAVLFAVSRLRRSGRSRRLLALPTFLWGPSSVFARRI